MTVAPHERDLLALAARLGVRAFGCAEPNPLVGCVIASPEGRILGMGHHTRFGAAHAEVEALASCRRQGHDPRGATAYVTLEPCAHHGKTPPCADALIEAGVARVVCARRDPHEGAKGGAERLRAAGVEVVFSGACEAATRLTDPFIKRLETGLPWVVAKWAQTIDGRIATRHGESQWISGAGSRRWVHLLRGRMDIVLTGVGTALADDPRLTARDVPVRRVARRVVVDPLLQTPLHSALVRSVDIAPLTIACVEEHAHGASADALRAAGVELLTPPRAPAPGASPRLDLAWLLRALVETHDATTVLVEAGARVVGSLIGADLVDEALVFIGPRLLADERALAPASGLVREAMADAGLWDLDTVRRSGDDAMLRWRRRRA
ncbi:MAG: bifunctional diaminohydroxyphosphoribosylaminopyrimidine deaminase/5-amino-6-(5-phosphoribosylamino)uracil reductase RibD [Phycisphaerales bacterium]